MSNETPKPTNSQNTASERFQLWLVTIPGIVTIIVALLTLVGTILGLLFNFEPFQKLFDTPATPTIQAIPSLTNTSSAPVVPIPSPTFTQILPIPYTAATATSSPSSAGVMYVILTANQTSGRQPLDVRFDARDSYYVAADGTSLDCGACEYYWQIRKDGVFIFGPEKTSGTLEYKFGSRGTYYVSVYVCRSGSETECNGTGIEINVN